MIHYLYHLDYPHQDDAAQSIALNAAASSFTFASPPPLSTLSKKTDTLPKKGGLFDGLGNAPLRPPSNLTIHAKVYALAEKYTIEGLKSLALKKFKTDLDLHWASADFLKAAKEVYTSTIPKDRPMRDVVVETFGRHPYLLNSEAAQNTVRELDLCYDLMMKFRPASTLFGGR